MTKKIKLKMSARLLKKRPRRSSSSSRRRCRFCDSEEQRQNIDYKNATFLRGFITERGKILASRVSGTCCRHQRALAKQIRKARTIALLPYTAQYF